MNTEINNSDYSELYNLAFDWVKNNIHRFMKDDMTEELVMFAFMAVFQCLEFTSLEESKDKIVAAKAEWQQIYEAHVKRVAEREAAEEQAADGAVG